MKYTARVLLLATVLVGGGVFTGYELHKEAEVTRLVEENRRLERQRAELLRTIARFSEEDRVAEVRVVDQKPVEENGMGATTIEFSELDRDGQAVSRRKFTVPGHVVYFDGWVIKFEDQLVGWDDELRGRSLLLFRRVFGENQAPIDGYPLDPQNDIPVGYRASPTPSEFERKLWDRFWILVRDPAAAKKEGVRVAQGEAVYAPMRVGDLWTLTLERDGGLNLRRGPAESPAEWTESPLPPPATEPALPLSGASSEGE